MEKALPPVKGKIAHFEAKSSKKSTSISEDTPGKLLVGGGGAVGEDREGSKTPVRSYTPLKTLQGLLDTVSAAPLSESDYNEKISEIDTFEANLIDIKTNDYYNDKTQLKSILEDNKSDNYIKQFNKLLKSVEITEKITSNSNVKRAKEFLDP
jgi:hypothetical protein